MEPTELDELKERIGFLEKQVKTNSKELGANSRATWVYLGGLFVVLIGLKVGPDGVAFAIPIEAILGAPVVASAVAALLDVRR